MDILGWEMYSAYGLKSYIFSYIICPTYWRCFYFLVNITKYSILEGKNNLIIGGVVGTFMRAWIFWEECWSRPGWCLWKSFCLITYYRKVYTRNVHMVAMTFILINNIWVSKRKLRGDTDSYSWTLFFRVKNMMCKP